MQFLNRRLSDEYEALQVDLLRTEVEMKRQQVESQRLANERERKLLQPAVSSSTFPVPAPTSIWGGANGVAINTPANDHRSLY